MPARDAIPRRPALRSSRYRPRALLAALSVVSLACGCAVGGSAPANGADQLRIVVSQAPSSLDPCDSHQARNGTLVRGNITEALLDLDVDTGELSPRLATSWAETAPTSWQFDLRPDVTFHDGQPFTVDAVVGWVNRIIDPDVGCYVLGSVLDENVQGAEAVDADTVQINLAAPDPILPIRMSFVDIGAPSSDPAAKAQEAVGTGPYRQSSFSPGQDFVMDRHDGYWGDPAAFDSVSYAFRPESSVRAAMASAGEVDLATAIGPQDADMPGAVTYTVAETLYYRYDLNPPLDDIRIRQAIGYAIDRQTLIDNVYGGDGEPANDIFLPSVSGHSDAVRWTFDPERAKQLIAEAAADGVPVQAPIDLVGERGIRGSNGSEIDDTLAAMLRAVGLNAQVATVEDTAPRLAEKPAPAAVAGIVQNVHGNSFGDAYISLSGKLGCAGPQSLLCDPTFDAMLAEAGAAYGDEREQKLEAAAEYAFVNAVPLVPLVHLTDTIVIADPAISYTPNPATSERLQISDITRKA